MRSFVTCTFAKYNENNYVKKNQMDRTCSTYGKTEEIIEGPIGQVRRKEATKKN
jgi:hypothetical protein